MENKFTCMPFLFQARKQTKCGEVLIIVIFSKLILSEGGGGVGRIGVRVRTILGVNLLHINQIQIILILHFFDIYFVFF